MSIIQIATNHKNLHKVIFLLKLCHVIDFWFNGWIFFAFLCSRAHI